MKRLLTIVSVLAIGIGFIAAQDRRPPGTNYKGPAFTFNKIPDGVYHAVGTGSLVVMSNATIIEGDRDVLVVDSHVRRAARGRCAKSSRRSRRSRSASSSTATTTSITRTATRSTGPTSRSSATSSRAQMIVAGKSLDSPAHEFFVGGVPTPSRRSKSGSRPRPTTRSRRRSRRSSTSSAITSKAPRRSSRRRRP